jgi:predicted DCC family thiol-disulfide oxidoreductase YuxK
MRDIIIYDGDCGICTAIVNWFIKKDRHGRNLADANQAINFGILPPGLTKEMAEKSVCLVDTETGKYYMGSRAFFETLKRLPALYGFIGSIFSLPFFSALFSPAYRFIASHRSCISLILGLKACQINNSHDLTRVINS